MIHKEMSMAGETSALLLHHFHLHHGDEVRTEVTATDGAESAVSVTSDGYTVDLTDPILDGLVDGLDSNKDPKFTVRNTNCIIAISLLVISKIICRNM